MRIQSFTTVSNVLLLSIILCITEFSKQDVLIEKSPVYQVTKASIELDADALNPIYIFK